MTRSHMTRSHMTCSHMTRSHMMRSHGVFLLLYLMALCWGTSFGVRNSTCPPGESCDPMGSAERFLQCVGLPSADTGPQHLHRLRSVMEALMDLYTYTRASMTGVPVLGLAGGLDLNLTPDPLQNEALVHMWLEVKMKPLLHSMSQQLLTCLSTKNFSCNTYQLMVKELSQHFSDLDSMRQKWIYDFFMFPFLSRDGMQGCVEPGQNSMDWLLKNFGDFRAMARVKDFSALYMNFSGLEVLDVLSPSQKADIVMNPWVAGLDNGTVHLVFQSMTGPGTSHNWTSPGYGSSTAPPGGPSSLSIDQSATQGWNDFMVGFRPISNLLHDFVILTNQRNVADIRSTDLIRLAMNVTLSELANMYTPAPSNPPADFDPTDVEDWYENVVKPVLLRFLPREHLSQTNISMAFHELFYLEHGSDEIASELEDVCSLNVDQAQCGLTDVVQDVAHVLHCADQTRLTLNEPTVLGLLYGLTNRLTSLLRELANTDLHAMAQDVLQIFSASASAAVSQQHLTDPDFVQMWFRVKLMPLLPDVPPGLLFCLSRKNFSCSVYQTIVGDLGRHMEDTSAEHHSRVYQNFVYPFLSNHNSSDAQCVSNNSAVWLQKNLGSFSHFAHITDLYRLNHHFSGLDALHHLSPAQVAQLLLWPLPSPPEKHQVVEHVFDFLLSAPHSHFRDVMDAVMEQASEMAVPCALYGQIFMGLYGSVPSVSPALEPEVWSVIEDLIGIAPPECVPANITCPDTQLNGASVCGHLSSNNTWSFSDVSMDSLCAFPLETYACAQLMNFSANHLASLLSCDLPGNSSRSKVLWKLLLTKHSPIVNPALDKLAAMPMTSIPSALEILDVLGEIRVSMLTEQDLRNLSLLHTWFSRRLGPFLPHASGRFLRCLSNRNLSCSSYQHILQIFSHSFENMTVKQQHAILKNYIVRFLSYDISGPGCVSMNTSEWLSQNLGHFSRLLLVKHLMELNPHFDPLDVLPMLSSKQNAELLSLPLPTDKGVLIGLLFDWYTQGAGTPQLPVFVSHLVHYVPQANLSCSDLTTLFNRLDLATASVSMETESTIIRTKMALSPHIPHGCVIYEGECTLTTTNETQVCAGVNSTSVQPLISQAKTSGRLCDLSVEQLACASLSALTAADLAELLTCSRPVNSSGSIASWKLLLSKMPHALDPALDLLANKTLDPTQAALPLILDAIREIRLEHFPESQINHLVIQEWLDKLRPFLSAVSMDFLHCLTTKALNCSTYQHFVHVLGRQQPHMPPSTQMYVYTHFIRVFLTRNDTADPTCSALSNDSVTWARSNLGAFFGQVPFVDLMELKPDFSPMEVLPMLNQRQLVKLCATPGQLQSEAQVNLVMSHVPDDRFMSFFEDLSAAINGHEMLYPEGVLPAFLEQVFERANLSDPSTPESVRWRWVGIIEPMLYQLSDAHVAPVFSIVSGMSCGLQERLVAQLNGTISSLSPETKDSVHDHVTQDLKGSIRCYESNHSFYNFLESCYMSFQFPNVTTILSLIPHRRRSKILNSMPIPHMLKLLGREDVTVTNSVPCEMLKSYTNTRGLLKERLPERIRRSCFVCVWPWALASSSPSDAKLWFRSLHAYLPYMTLEIMSASSNSSCVGFRSFVAAMGEFNFTGKDFNRRDVFRSIRAYLRSDSSFRCYNSSDPYLNSTAAFAQYIGPFFDFMTLEDFLALGSEEALQVFTVDPENIALLNHSALPQNLTDYYTQLVYQQDSNFNPLMLPLLCRCVAPGPAFSQLKADETMMVLYNLTNACSSVDPQIRAALAGNLGHNIDEHALEALGQQSAGLTVAQLKVISGSVLLGALPTLSGVTDWSTPQARAIIQILMSEGKMKVSASSLLMLGTLLKGLPSTALSGISSSELQNVSQNPAFLQNLMSAPAVTRQIFIRQLISGSSSSADIVGKVPDDLAGQIPRVKLVSVSSSVSVLQKVNRKKWKRQQVELFFNVIAQESATAALNGTDALSSSVLQGFTCTSVRTLKRTQIRRLVKACRRKGRNKVQLVESQLTCMYFYIKNESDALNFSLFPPDMLLYYDYSLVPSSSCRSYFEQLADADFSVFSSSLSYKRDRLVSNAMSCLGITSTNLTQDQVSVLGNMCCFLDSSYIPLSHPSILEKLKQCPELTEDQASSVETLLTSGSTPYGSVSEWNLDTLKDLGTLTLSLPSSFYDHFTKKTKRSYLRYFRKDRKEKFTRKQWRSLKNQIRKSIRSKTKRAADCTVGEINHVTVSDETFPLDYTDVQQFNSCLSAATVKDDLGAITAKVDDQDLLKVVLAKLNEAYAGSTPLAVPEDQVQALGPASRVATEQDISLWTITTQDTLAALMDSADGAWEPNLAKAVIEKYLSAGNSLGTTELNVIEGPNLCLLDLETLQDIPTQSLRDCKALDVSSCSLEKKQALFAISSQGYVSATRSAVSVSSYQLIQPYMGGANESYVKGLVSSNVNMDLPTFTSLDPNVVQSLSVGDVQGLLGSNTEELKSYENNTVVRAWISSRDQTDLDTMNIGLTGGRTTTTSAPGVSSNTGAPTTAANTNPATANTSPATANTSPATANTSPATANTSPATANTSPATANTSPATANTSPATANTSPATASTTASSDNTTVPSDNDTPAPSNTTASSTDTTAAGSTAAATSNTPSPGASTEAKPTQTTAGSGTNPATTTKPSTVANTTKPNSSVALSAPGGLSLLLLLLFSTWRHIFT